MNRFACVRLSLCAHRAFGRPVLAAAGLALAAPVLLAAPPAGARPRVELQCVAWGTGPMLECTVDLQRRDGTPLEGAKVTLGALMPSMPMAHTVKPAVAVATARPGQYRATLELEMLGVWAVEVDIAAPVRDKVSRSLRVRECPADSRCAADPVRAGAAPARQAAHRH